MTVLKERNETGRVNAENIKNLCGKKNILASQPLPPPSPRQKIEGTNFLIRQVSCVDLPLEEEDSA